MLQRQVADQQLKNAEMYKVAMELLTRFESFSLGEAIRAREPFLGISKVKLQTLFQDTADRITDAKIRPADGKVSEQKKSEQKVTETKVVEQKTKTEIKKP